MKDKSRQNPGYVNRQIECCCIDIRNAICNIKDKTHLFGGFPRGCCRDASLMLGEFLKTELNLTPLYYCSTGSDTIPSHAWLEFNDLIIDITADQFGDYPPIIISRFTNFWFHEKNMKEIVRFEIAQDDIKILSNDYALVTCAIRERQDIKKERAQDYQR